MVEHIWKNRFTPGYTRWIFHGEAHRTREEVLRQHVEDYDADAGIADMLNDNQETQYNIENTLSYRLAEKNVIENTSWIKPGLASWEWWNRCV